MRGPGDFAPAEHVPTEEDQARDRCAECGSWGPCLDTCPAVARENAAIEGARRAIHAEVTCTADETASECDAPDCVKVMSPRDVYAWTSIDGATARVCSEACLLALSAAEVARTTCTYCDKPTPPDDRVAVENPGPAIAHATCVARLENAAFYQAIRGRMGHA